MLRTPFLIALFVVGLISVQAYGQDQKQKDAENLIKAARFLEEKPLDKEAKGIRGWAVGYLIETKDINIIVCGGDLMQPLLDKKNKNSVELIAQYTVGMGAFKAANPDKKDENEAQFAGLESALKAYKVIIAEKPKTRTPGMDDLVTKLDKGELKSLVIAADCAKKQ